MPSFYLAHGGAVVSMTIDKYIYVSVNPKFDGRIRLSYSITEDVEKPEDLKHDVVREALRTMNLMGLEITSVSDIPGEGSGLGSSSSFAVGLLAALSEHTCGKWSPGTLAELAYIMESKLCNHSTGKQDQYAAAWGGLHLYEFHADGAVGVTPYDLLDEEKCQIMQNIMLLWIGNTRSSREILIQQGANLQYNHAAMGAAKEMKELAYQFHDALRRHDFDPLGELLHQNWELKKRLSSGITDEYIDAAYQRARAAGASGGKVCGAGGGGFLLLWARPEVQDEVERAVGWRRFPVRMEERGSTVIYKGE